MTREEIENELAILIDKLGKDGTATDSFIASILCTINGALYLEQEELLAHYIILYARQMSENLTMLRGLN
ncbi:MAG: hypothetical protein AABY22_13185 [Nanoarchaeota archaeon]